MKGDFGVTKREKDVLLKLLAGKNNKEIARQLFISFNTVRTHRRHIYKKLGCRNIASLIKAAIDRNLLSDGDLEFCISETPQATLSPTNREFEIILLTSIGLSNREISIRLSVKLSTIKKHKENIHSKYNIRKISQFTILSLVQR